MHNNAQIIMTCSSFDRFWYIESSIHFTRNDYQRYYLL